MLKFFFVFLTSLLLNGGARYQEIAGAEEEAIRDEMGGYVLFEEGGDLLLRHKAGSWTVRLPKAPEYRTALKKGNYLYLFSTEAGLEAQEYDPSGKLIRSAILIANPLALRDAVYQDGLFVCGHVEEYREDFLLENRGERKGEDAILLSFDDDFNLRDFRIYGGFLDESFLKLVPAGGKIYVAGRKDPESGGDFGNGGREEDAVFVARLSDNLDLEDYRILANNREPLAFLYHKEALYLALPDRLYKFDFELKTVLKKILSGSYRAAVIGEFNKCLLFGTNEIEIVDILDFSSEKILSEYLKEDAEIRVFPEGMTVGGVRYDLACLEEFIVFEKYLPEIETAKTVKTIFGKAEFLEESSEPYFDPQIHGDYRKEYLFKSVHGLNFTVTKTVRVEMRANVSNNFIYPYGYRLQFTGYAELDGKSILNNHVLETEGTHRLVLTDNAGKRTEIVFAVSKAQISFSETSGTFWDYEVTAGEPFFLELSLAGVGERVLKGVVINGEEIKNLLYNPAAGILTIPLEADSPGIRHYYLEKLLYLEEGKLLNIPLCRLVTVNILGKAPQVGLRQLSPLAYEVEVRDDDATLRSLEVFAANGEGETRRVYPLGTGNLNISLPSGVQGFEINLLFDRGNKNLESLPLFSGKLSGGGEMKIGEINIIRKSASLEKFNIVLEEEVLELKSQDRSLYRKNPSGPLPFLLFGALAGAAGFSGTILFSKLRKRMKKASA